MSLHTLRNRTGVFQILARKTKRFRNSNRGTNNIRMEEIYKERERGGKERERKKVRVRERKKRE